MIEFRNARWLTAFVVIVGSGIVFAVLFGQFDPRAGSLALNTFQLCAGAIVISLPLGTVFAVILSRTDAIGRGLARVILVAMLFVPLYLQAAAWDAGFGQLGWYSVARDEVAKPWLSGWRAAIWIHAMAGVPWVTLLVSLGLQFVGPKLEERASLEGPPLRVLLFVTFPRALPALGVAVVWVIVSTAAEMTITDIYQIRTYAEEVYTSFALGEDAAEVWASIRPGVILLAWLVVIVVVTVATVVSSVVRTSVRSNFRFSLRRWRFAGSIGLWFGLLVVAGLPLANLIYRAGVVVRQIGDDRMRVWSLLRFWDTVASVPREFLDDFGWSFLIGGWTGFLSLLIALPLGWSIRRGGWKAIPVLCGAAVCLVTPGPMIAVAVEGFLNHPYPVLIWLYDQTVVAPVCAVTIRCLPMAIFLAWYGFRSFDETQLENAAVAGVGSVGRFLRIALPQRMALVALIWITTFAIAIGDLATSILVLPPGVNTIAYRIFNLIHYGVRYQEAGVSLVLLTIIGGVVGGLTFLRRRCFVQQGFE